MATFTPIIKKFADFIEDLKQYFVQKSGDTVNGNLNVTGDLQVNGKNVAIARFGTTSNVSDHATALKNFFEANKASIPRSRMIGICSSVNNNDSIAMGQFISGQDSTPYGGFFVAHYDVPYYVGIRYGTYKQYRLTPILVSESRTYTSKTSLSDTGVTYSVPAGYVAVLTFWLAWGTGRPQEISVREGKTSDWWNSWGCTEVQNEIGVRTTVITYGAKTLYVWAKVAASATNKIVIEGVLIPVTA